MKRLLIFLAFLPFSILAQSYFDSASTPADNAANATSVVSVTPPASMATGDLVVLVAQARTTTTTADMDGLGGQTWTSANLAVNTTNLTCRVFWCRFNGTWSANPSVFFGSAASTSVSMHVFRPGTATNTWALDQTGATANYAAPGGPPYVVTRTGQTTVSPNVVALFILLSIDDNRYFKSAGTATVVNSAQYRNTSSGGQCHAVWYEVFAAASSATGDLSARQTALGPDAGSTAILLFKEYAPTNNGIPSPMLGN